MRHLLLPISLLLLPVLAACDASSSAAGPVRANEADAHEHEPRQLTVFGERVFTFLEHPQLVRGESARFLVHLTRLSTGEPVRAGRVTLTLGAREFSVDAPQREGVFILEGAAPTAGTFPLRLVLKGEQTEETLDLGTVQVHESEEAAHGASDAAAEGESEAAGIPFLLEQQWPLRMLLAKIERRELARRLVVPASVRLPDGASADVHAPVGGRLVPVEGRAWPRSGERVKAGDVLFGVEPPVDAATIAQLHALRLELEMQLVEAVHEVEHSKLRRSFAQRELDRLRELRPEGLSTLPELDASELEVEMTLHEEELALGRKQTVERLIADRAPFDAQSGSPVVRVPVLAPIDGVVSWSPHSAGANVTPDTELVRIVDTSRVWIEGRVSEFDLHRVVRELGATATFLGLPGERLELVGAPWIAPRVSEESRAVAVRFAAENPGGKLIDGQLAELELRTDVARDALSVPHEAIVMDQGVPTAYVMRSGETFERRVLRLGLRDGEQVEVLEGLAENERVVTRGAYIVRLSSMAPASMEHHDH